MVQMTNFNLIFLILTFECSAAKQFLAVANEPKAESWALGYVTASVGKKNTVVLHRSFDADVDFDKQSFTTAELVDWVSEHAYPYVVCSAKINAVQLSLLILLFFRAKSLPNMRDSRRGTSPWLLFSSMMNPKSLRRPLPG